ncbi:hypothetical protein [Ectothiorhodospira lacustris]|uniref:hypothetical protein n=1 Tax=Ectothiorhodospira lacustris TaxID=2899127 RepID=UPI001EE7DF84|nr:hypothetical protein [Ectothiorhodospira lacustris]MCG5510349.1 hypothetical protein [Ectothiorhodospira lacustris]MCG5522095.1 hypothetical protein [Ectothiorhodospira lacustris]
MPSLAKYKKRLFNWNARGILKTAPIVCNPESQTIILSQSHDPDLIMLLIAAKSLAQFITPRSFFIIDDGLCLNHREIIEKHLGTVEFIRTSDIDVGQCPRGGCWERLVMISCLCPRHYVIQLDSDTVTAREPTEVLQCIQQNRCFTLGTRLGRSRTPVHDASKLAHAMESQHIQVLAERALCNLPNALERSYIRGCAGFAGFAMESIKFQELENFSVEMEKQLGNEKWSSWGSEQVASNYMIANTDNPLVLPFEHYPYWDLKQDLEDGKIIHFIGGHRFDGGAYTRQAKQIIKSLPKSLGGAR